MSNHKETKPVELSGEALEEALMHRYNEQDDWTGAEDERPETAPESPISEPETGHTPGPWISTPDAQILAPNPQMVDGPQVEIAQVHNVFGRDGFCQTHLNCRLIAAAPELLEALKAVERWMSGYGTKTQVEMREEVRAVIAKAEGRA